MKDEAIARVRAETDGWAYLKELPEERRGFRLRLLQAAREDGYDLYAYENGALHRSVTAYYHAETDEYKLRLTIGSFEFCHTECIAPDLEAFERVLRERLDGLLAGLTASGAEGASSLLLEKRIVEWEAEARLPESLEGFTLFIRPSNPLRFTNGSYVVVDYENFSCRSNFAVYYNVFRDAFFSDARVADIPEMNYAFDSKTLEELREKLLRQMPAHLRAIRERAEKEISA